MRVSKGVRPVPLAAPGGPKNLPSNRERELNANHDTQALLKVLPSKQNGVKAPETWYSKIADFHKSIEALTKDLLLLLLNN